MLYNIDILVIIVLIILVAVESSDPLALHLFNRAGHMLGRHVKALIPKADKVHVCVVKVGY